MEGREVRGVGRWGGEGPRASSMSMSLKNPGRALGACGSSVSISWITASQFGAMSRPTRSVLKMEGAISVSLPPGLHLPRALVGQPYLPRDSMVHRQTPSKATLFFGRLPVVTVQSDTSFADRAGAAVTYSVPSSDM